MPIRRVHSLRLPRCAVVGGFNGESRLLTFEREEANGIQAQQPNGEVSLRPANDFISRERYASTVGSTPCLSAALSRYSCFTQYLASMLLPRLAS
jgi:hypothetical protein